MDKEMKSYTHEVKMRGSPSFPVAFYQNSFSEMQEDGLVIPFGWHYEMEIVLATEGTVYLCRNNEKFALQCGDFAVLNRMELHSFRACSKNGSYEAFLFPVELLYFESFDDLDTSIVRKIGTGELILPSSVLNEQAYGEIQSIVKALFAIKEKKDKMLIRLYLYQLMCIFAHYDLLIKRHKKEEITEETFLQLYSYVLKRYKEKISLNEVAGQFGFTPQSFCSYFKNYMGMPFVKYLNYFRLDKAYNAIISTSESITDISLQVGFDSVSYFNKKFKETYKITPSQLRKKAKESKY